MTGTPRVADCDLRRRRKGTGGFDARGYKRVGQDLEHRLIAARALGHPLPRRAVVHHVDGDVANNAPANLVICPDQAYHRLIHQRDAAQRACGNANWRKCAYCKVFDAPEHLICRPHIAWHRMCINAYDRKRHQRKKTPCQK
jgi:hypothetical protein